MYLDASAIVAIIAREADADELAARAERAGKLLVSPLTLYESVSGIARSISLDQSIAQSLVDRFNQQLDVRFVAIDEAVGRVALEAFQRFGKGRHRAKLNMGDCFAYACARIHKVPLLCKGDDFVHTDIEIA